MKKYKYIIIFLNLVLILVVFNYFVLEKQKILSQSQLVYLEMAPVDPRSLMQGDYMNLRYRISEFSEDEHPSDNGFIVINILPNNVAKKVRIQQQPTPLSGNEHLIKYRNYNVRVTIGAESYFFQEDKAELYRGAKYAGVKIDDKGNTILVGLYDEDFKKLQ